MMSEIKTLNKFNRRNEEDEMKSISEYKSLRQVPINHPEFKYKCLDPSIMCAAALSN